MSETSTDIRIIPCVKCEQPLEKTLMLEEIEGKRGRGWQRMRWLDGIIDSMDMNLSKLGDNGEQWSVACCSPWGHQESGTTE